MADYRWKLAGMPFTPQGVVTKDGNTILRLDYEGQNEKLLVARLAAIVRAMKSVDRKLGESA